MAKKSTGKKKSGSIWRWIFAVLFIGAAFTDGFTFGCLVIGLALLAPEIIAAIMVFAGRKSTEKKPQIQNIPVSAPVAPKPSLVKYNSCSRIIQDNYVILDVETTGLSPELDRVIEIAVVKAEGGQVVDTFSSLVNPERMIPETVVKLTNITQDMVEDAPAFSALAETIVSFIGDLPVVAHNASFDASFLAEELNRAGIPFQFQYIDSIRLAKKAYPDMPNYKLKTLIKKLSLADHAQQHRAADDAMCTQRLYELCKQEIGNLAGKMPSTDSTPTDTRRPSEPAELSKSASSLNAKPIDPYKPARVLLIPQSLHGERLAYKYEQVEIYLPEEYLKGLNLRTLPLATRVELRQEPENPHDKNAVAVYLEEHKIGYLYRGTHQDMANDYISAGLPIFSAIQSVDDNKGIIMISLAFYKSPKHSGETKTFKLGANKNAAMQEALGLVSIGDTVSYYYDVDKGKYIASVIDDIGSFPKSAEKYLADDPDVIVSGLDTDDNGKAVVFVDILL